MKKALSFILAFTLAFALLPTFAFAVDMEPAETTGTQFSIDFADATAESIAALVAYSGDRKLIKQGATFEGTNWKFFTTASTSIYYNNNATNITYYNSSANKRILLELSSAEIEKKNNTARIDFTVPTTGYYDISGKSWHGGSGGKAEVIIDGKSVGTADTYGKAGTSYPKVAVQTDTYDKNVFLTAGTHKMEIKVTLTDRATLTTAQVPVLSFTFTPSATKVVNPNVSFVQTTNIDGYDDIFVTSVARGKNVALTAHKQDIEGYKFVGWKRGAGVADEDTWVNISGDSYNVWTNTFLTAIYEPVAEDADKVVEFWNQNGAYIGSATEATYADAINKVPTIIGFGEFLGWFTDGRVELDANTELKAGTTNAVAQYEEGTVGGVTFNGAPVSGADTYDKAITLTESGATCWKRDGEIIAYGDTYTYNVWAGTAITSSTEAVADALPVAILEYNEGYDAYMLEYDAGDYAIAEAGIIFGGAGTVDSCAKKYTSQRKVDHNQFTVPAEEGTAKGYIIYTLDGGATYKIDYFSVNQ